MSGSAQINSVIAGRVLWADFGDVRERVAPSENATANLSVPTASVARDRANAAIGGAGGCSVRGPGGPSYSVGRIGPSYFFGGTGTGDLVLRGTNIGDT